tara:strand:+ start:130 stop:1242 length:1113 start_codon:yes stop_codon:yes gene_type:complete
MGEISNNYAMFSGDNPFATQAKMLLHLDKLHQYKTTGDTDCPVFMEIGLTDKCNMACYWCITELGRDNKAGLHISIHALKQYFKDFAEMGGKAVTFAGQGEPTFYPDFEEAVISAKEAGLELGMMTNAVFKKKYCPLIAKNFQWIRISLDTLDEEKYKEWKEINGVGVIKRNIEEMRNIGDCRIGINCNVGPNITLQHAKDLVEWVNASDNISYLQFRPILPRFYKEAETAYKETGTAEINTEVWAYLDSLPKELMGKINLSDDKRRDLRDGTAFSFRSCEGHFFEPILTAAGDVKVCTYHPDDPKLAFGNINTNSFKEIWKSEQRKEAIKYVRSLNYKEKCQMCCKLAEPNKLIDFINHPEETQDINFL